MTRLL